MDGYIENNIHIPFFYDKIYGVMNFVGNDFFISKLFDKISKLRTRLCMMLL